MSLQQLKNRNSRSLSDDNYRLLLVLTPFYKNMGALNTIYI